MCKHCPPKPKPWDAADLAFAFLMAATLVVVLCLGVVQTRHEPPPAEIIDAKTQTR
jgi:hypothetical protein